MDNPNLKKPDMARVVEAQPSQGPEAHATPSARAVDNGLGDGSWGFLNRKGAIASS